MSDVKKELHKIIDKITVLKEKQQKLGEERTKLTAKHDSELSSIYTELDALYEKKRLLETDYLASLRLNQ